MLETRTEAAAAHGTKAPARNRRAARLLVALLCVGLSAVAVVPFFFMARPEPGNEGAWLRMPVTHDMFLHYDQMKSFYTGLAAGSIYPRWEEDTNFGFGAPTMSYYPPGIYYLTSAFFAMSHDWVEALLGAHLLMMIASAAAIYFYARRVMSRGASAVAMAAYIILPYHLVDQYHRGAIAELLGFIWMPLVLMFGERFFRESYNGRRSPALSGVLLNSAGLALSYGAFLWSHPPTAYQFTLAFALYILLLALLRKEFKPLLLIGCALGVGLTLAAAYMYPAAVEQDLIRHEYITETWPYHNTYVFVHDLYNRAGNRGFFNLIDGLWIFGAALIPATGAAHLFFNRGSGFLKDALRQRVLLWAIVGCAATFMMTEASYPVGRLIPRIEIGVFTWRMLSITTLVMALLAGAAVERAGQALKRGIEPVALTTCALLIIVGGAALTVLAVARPTFHSAQFVPSEEHFNYATIPRTAIEDPDELPDDVPPAELENENGEVTVERWDPEYRLIRVNLSEDDALLIRTFLFPGWTATVDGKAAEIIPGEELGDMVIELPASARVVELKFLPTPVRRRAVFITIFSFATVMIITLAGLLLRLRERRYAGRGIEI